MRRGLLIASLLGLGTGLPAPATAAFELPMACRPQAEETRDYLDLARSQDRFRRCLRAHDEGDFAVAAGCYASLIDEGHDRAHVLYNLGNALYRRGEVACAQLAWRSAELRAPRDPDVRENLATARGHAVDVLPADDTSALRSALLFWYDHASPDELWWGAAALLLLAASLSLLTPPRRGWTALALGLGVVLMGAALLRGWQQRRAPMAIVLVSEVAAHSGRDPASVELFRVHAGAELTARTIDEDVSLVALPDGTRGWIPTAALGFVR